MRDRLPVSGCHFNREFVEHHHVGQNTILNEKHSPPPLAGRLALVRLWSLLGIATLAMPIQAAQNALAAATEPAPCFAQQSLDLATGLALDGFVRAVEPETFWNAAERLQGFERALNDLGNDGLAPTLYGVQQVAALAGTVAGGGTVNRCQARELSLLLLNAVADLHYGRVSPKLWFAQGSEFRRDPKQLLRLVEDVDQIDIAEVFARARPNSLVYDQLRNHYKQFRAASGAQWTTLAEGATLAAGMIDARVPLLKQRLREEHYLPSTATADLTPFVYGADTVAAVKAFQQQQGLAVDGVVGGRTLAALNETPAQRGDHLRANLERLRWYARMRSDTMLVVDIAGAMVSYFHNGKRRFHTRAQAGTPDRETPPLKSVVSHVTVNPTWTVPPTILKKDLLPKVRADINYLEEKHIRVLDSQWQVVDPADVDWDNTQGLFFRQDAGPDNPLGQVAIRFDNPFAVYLHDTPNRRLFSANSRFYSSGCVRVDGAPALTELLFADGDSSGAAQAELLAAQQTGLTRNLDLPAPVPVLMVYWTAAYDEQRGVVLRPDVYQRDAALVRDIDRG